MRKLVSGLGVLILLITFTVPALAGNTVVHHRVNVEESESFPVGPKDAACFGVPAGTMINAEVSLDWKVTEIVDGPQARRIHTRGETVGAFRVEGTEITGSFVNHYNEQVTDDDELAKQAVRISATAADGSPIEMLVNTHFVMHDGDVKVGFGKVNCIK